MARLKKKMCGFRLSLETIQRIKELAESEQVAQVDIIVMAVNNYKRRNK